MGDSVVVAIGVGKNHAKGRTTFGATRHSRNASPGGTKSIEAATMLRWITARVASSTSRSTATPPGTRAERIRACMMSK